MTTTSAAVAESARRDIVSCRFGPGRIAGVPVTVRVTGVERYP